MSNLEKIFSRYQMIVPDFKDFLDFLEKPLPISFRINTLKCKQGEVLNLLKDFNLTPLKVFKDGFILNQKLPFGNHYTHQLGLIYIQETASMIPALVLDPKPNDVVLDLCAAPGSKTTQIAQAMDNKGLLVVNEVNRKRMMGLIHNIKRCGLLNEVVISMPGEKIGDILPGYFDRILLDAPCSAEGTIRKSRAVLYHWGLKNIQKMARIQKGLITSAFKALQSGGVMVYSTCTIAPEENEGVVNYLLKKFPEAEILPFSIPNFKIREGITKWENESFDPRVKHCVRILPQDNDTAPFFIARITKMGMRRSRAPFYGRIEFQNKIIDKLSQRFDFPPDSLRDYAVFQKYDTYYIATHQSYSFFEINSIRKGLEIGWIYDNEIKPDNDFVQLFARSVTKNSLEVKDWEMKRFLHGENISCPKGVQGFVIVRFKGIPIGVGRANGYEIKPSIKSERRIRFITSSGIYSFCE